MRHIDSTVRAAYSTCRGLAGRHYENFPVASLLVPSEKRDALAAIYAFARYADDMADEPGVRGRLRALAEWRSRLRDCASGKAEHPVFIALADAMGKYDLSPEHFENLLRAFEMDVQVNRHPDFDSLLGYCKCSANPVGRLVLELFGHRDPELFSLSDNICAALQLTNFWQDIRVDVARDRLYLPLEDLRRFDISVDDVRSLTGEASEPFKPGLLERWRALMAFQAGRTRALFERGKPLPEKVAAALRRQLRLTWLGGMAILAKIEGLHFETFRRRPALSRLDFLRLYFKARRPLALEMAEPAPTIASHP